MDVVKFAFFVAFWAVGRAECVVYRDVHNPFPYLLKVTVKDVFIGTGSLLTPMTVMAPYKAFFQLEGHEGASFNDIAFTAVHFDSSGRKCSVKRFQNKMWNFSARNEVWFRVDPPFAVKGLPNPYLFPRLDDMNASEIRNKLIRFQNSQWYEPCVFATWESKNLNADWMQRGVRIISRDPINVWIKKFCATFDSKDVQEECLGHAPKANFFAVPTEEIPDDWTWMTGSVVFCWGQAMGHLREVLHGDKIGNKSEKVLGFESLEQTVFHIRNKALSEWPEFSHKTANTVKTNVTDLDEEPKKETVSYKPVPTKTGQ